MVTYNNVLRALADPTRRSLFDRLRAGPKSVGELAVEMPVSQPAVSQHLRVLRGAGLVDVRRDGARRIYSVSSTGLEVLRAYIASFQTDGLEALADPPNWGGTDE